MCVSVCACASVCVYMGVDRASRLLVIVIICATGCALMLPPHSSCAHAPLSLPPESRSGGGGTPVCPFRCTGGGSGEGQIVYVYLLTSLTCWCSLVNVLRVKHLLFFPHPSVSLAHDRCCCCRRCSSLLPAAAFILPRPSSLCRLRRRGVFSSVSPRVVTGWESLSSPTTYAGFDIIVSRLLPVRDLPRRLRQKESRASTPQHARGTSSVNSSRRQ